MIIFCSGMLRSASTVQYQLTADIVESLGIGRRLGFYDKNNFSDLIKQARDERVIYVVKCHWFYKEAGELIRNRKAKAIYIHRDMRDVIVSMSHHANKSFYRLAAIGLVEKLMRSHYNWIDTGNILISRYEEMIFDRKREVGKIARYLGLNIDARLIQTIAERYGIEQQRARISAVDYDRMCKKFGRDDAPDAHSLLKKNHIRSGLTGQWKDELNWFQISLLEGLAGRWLLENGYALTKPKIMQGVASLIYVISMKPLGRLYSFVQND